jgi:hypothetical protein
VNCTGNPSSFATSGLSTLTVNVGLNTSFNGPFSASTMNQIDVTSTNSNFQSVTFNAIGLVNFSLTGGNVNSGITITNGGSANITNSANINQTFTFSGTGNFTLFNTGILNPGGIILYRPEVALAAVVPEVARNAVRTTLGTFHDREGEQAFASGDGGFKAGWARVFGRSYQQTWTGDINPSFNGSIWGIQAGFPVLGLEHSGGEKDRAGLFFAYTNANGSVTGFVGGQQGALAGSLGVNLYSVGAYWTHFWPAGGYLDAVLMETFMTATTLSLPKIPSELD